MLFVLWIKNEPAESADFGSVCTNPGMRPGRLHSYRARIRDKPVKYSVFLNVMCFFFYNKKEIKFENYGAICSLESPAICSVTHDKCSLL